jgi:CheY-like chemotaxis protein
MSTSDRPTILVVEDDDDTRTVLQDLLELNGFRVRTCQDARHAIEAARAEPPALMLIDYLMPDGDGAFVVRALREGGGAPAKVPVVFATGSAEGRDEAQRLGVRSLEKPFDVNRLLDLVRSMVPTA